MTKRNALLVVLAPFILIVALVMLASTGAVAQTVEPPTIDFGNVEAGDTTQRAVEISTDETITLCSAEVTVSTSAATLTVSPETSGTVVTTSTTATINVVFEASDAVSETTSVEGTVTIPYREGTATTGPCTAVLTATIGATITPTGVQPPPAPGVTDITVTPTSINFGCVPVGDTETEAVTIRNVSADTITITDISSPSAPFSIATPTVEGVLLGPAGSTTDTTSIVARFSPETTGTFTSSFVITTIDPQLSESSATVALSGESSFTCEAPAPPTEGVPDILVSPL